MSGRFNPGYYTETELQDEGFAALGEDVIIAKNCTIIGADKIRIGSHVRIDGYTTIVASGDGYVNIGSYIHIGSYCFLSGSDGITLEDFSGLSQMVRLYSRSDDYSGESLTNPTVPEEFTNIAKGAIKLARHVIVGSGSIILPGIEVGEGSAVGASSVVMKSLDAWGIYVGNPARKVKARSQNLLELEKKLLQQG